MNQENTRTSDETLQDIKKLNAVANLIKYFLINFSRSLVMQSLISIYQSKDVITIKNQRSHDRGTIQ